MKISFEFSNLCGSSYKGGNVIFTKDGNCVLSPVGNRISEFDLVKHKCSTFPFENQNNIVRIVLSPNGQTLISVDADGRAILASYHKRVVLNRFTFKEPIVDIKYSPNSKFIAVTKSKQLQVWVAPTLASQYAPFTLHRTYGSHYHDITHINWSNDSQFMFTCSGDNSVKMFSLDPIDGFHPLTLNGHRDKTIATFMDAERNLYTVAKDGAVFVWSFNGKDNSDSLANGRFALEKKFLLSKDFAKIECAAFHQCNDLNFVAIGFSSGVFSLYELPSCEEIHSLSISQHHINSVAINPTGEWLAFGSEALGQLLVWEWQSETYVLKQQGHFNDVTAVAYSPDGQLMATGGEDGKVKIWNSTSGFCFATFTDHSGPVTAIEFTSAGNVIVSASLDGTVRAFDLIRYRNFRTLVAPSTCQFLSLAIDPSGEIICAGSMDPFDIFVWSLQTGRLLDILSGHEGPVCSLSFSPEQSILASASWDKTAKIWDVFERKATIDTLNHNSDVLAVTFRSDGNEICTSSLDGQLYFWDVNQGVLKGTIECKCDIMGGRRRANSSSTEGFAFTTISYSADSKCVLAGGDSNNICLFDIEQRSLLRKFKISSNRAIDGVADKLNSKRMTDSGNIDDIDASDSDDDDLQTRIAKRDSLPGVHRGEYSSRRVPPAVHCRSLRFSPTGRSWAAAATEGLLIFSLDQELRFDPVDLDIDITPATILATLKNEEYSKALLMALRLNETVPLHSIIVRAPIEDISLVVHSIPSHFLERVINLISDGIEQRTELECYLLWAVQVLVQHGSFFKRHSNQLLGPFRSLQKTLVKVHRNLSSVCDSNKYQLQFLLSRCQRRQMTDQDEMMPAA